MRSNGHCRTIAIGLSAGLLGTLAGCGGGSVPASTPAPVASQTPAPAPTPPPPGPSSVVDAGQEAANSISTVTVGAPTAYAQGITGKGVTLAILDTGLNADSVEFTGRIDPTSKDFVSGGVIKDSSMDKNGIVYPYGHGTAVANVIAAAKNGLGIYGVAYEATLYASRIFKGDLPADGTETKAQLNQDNVNFYNNFANGLIGLRTANARAVNLSLGGSSKTIVASDPGSPAPPSLTLLAAYDRSNAEITNSFNAGVIIVNAAGNDHAYVGGGKSGTEVTDSTGKVVGSEPNSFPQHLVSFSGTNGTSARDIPLLIVGALDSQTNAIAYYSNRAGTGDAAKYYLVAPSNITAPYYNGALYTVDGTSFAAPYVTGAIGLLAQKFPMLTGLNIADLLLNTATHMGTSAVGTLDPIYGHGLLNIAAAFQPQGSASVQTSSGIVTLSLNSLSQGLTSQLSPAFGDGAALRSALAATVYLDSYKRPYTANLAGSAANARRTLGLAGLAATATRQISSNGSVKGVSFNFSAERGDFLPASYSSLNNANKPLGNVQFDANSTLNKNVSVRFASGTGDSRVLGLSTDSNRDLLSGYDDRLLNIAAPSQKFGFGVNAQVGNIELLTGWSYARDNGQSGNAFTQTPITVDKVAMHVRRQWPHTMIEAGMTLQTEHGSVLGSRPVNGLGFGSGTRGLIGRLSSTYSAGPWTMAATGHVGRIGILGEPGGIISKVDSLLVSAFAASVRYALPQDVGNFVFGVSQPLRVESGTAHISVPTSYDYTSFQLISTPSAVSLSPSGREMDMEFGLIKTLPGYGVLQLNTFDRFNPGNNATIQSDKGILLRWKSLF